MVSWEGRRQSRNVEDRREPASGRRPSGAAMGGGLGIGGVVLVLAFLALGGDPAVLLAALEEAPTGGGAAPPEDDRAAAFVAVMLADTEDVWHAVFREAGGTYAEPRLVLFRDEVRSACGVQGAAVGPFYCPADATAYLDLGFFDTLARQLGAPGDFAQAYVLAHEVGHHVQNLTGVAREVDAARRRGSERDANALSVRQELQADCYAGLWAHHADRAKGILERGDVEEGLRAASSIGDDTLQRQAGRRVVPDAFTHGTSEQRVRWFRRGLEAGTMAACDTFAAERL